MVPDASIDEAARAWKLLQLNWLLVASMSAVLVIGAALTSFRISPTGYAVVFAISAIYGLYGYHNATSVRRHPRVFVPLSAIAQAILIVAVMTSMTYVATAANLQLRELRASRSRSRARFRFSRLSRFHQCPSMAHHNPGGRLSHHLLADLGGCRDLAACRLLPSCCGVCLCIRPCADRHHLRVDAGAGDRESTARSAWSRRISQTSCRKATTTRFMSRRCCATAHCAHSTSSTWWGF